MIGTIFFLLGIFIVTSMSAVIRYIGVNDVFDMSKIMFFRSFVASMIVLPFAFREIHQKKKEILKDRKILSIISFFAIADSFAYVYALKYLNVNTSASIMLMAPLIVSIIARVILKEKLSYKVVIGIVVNLCIVALFKIKGDFSEFNIGYVILAIAIVSGGTRICITKFVFKKYSNVTLLFLQIAGICIVSFFISSDLSFSFTKQQFLLLFIVSFGYLTERLCFLYAYKFSTISRLQPLRYFNIPIAAIMSFLILGEKLSNADIAVAIVIVLVNLWVNRG